MSTEMISAGTLQWQAPETMSGRNQETTPAVDVWAFAITCSEILNMGKLPWGVMDDVAVRSFVLSSFDPFIPIICRPILIMFCKHYRRRRTPPAAKELTIPHATHSGSSRLVLAGRSLQTIYILKDRERTEVAEEKLWPGPHRLRVSAAHSGGSS